MRGDPLKLGLLFFSGILLFSTGAHSEPASETLRFAIMRNNQQIGTSTVQLHRNGRETVVEMVTRIAVKIAFVTVYRFEQTENERWSDGRLVSLHAVTDDNGTVHRVTASSSNNKIRVDADGKVIEVAGTTIPVNLANPVLLQKTAALNPQDGRIVPVSVVDRGEDHLVVQGQPKRARHYVISTTFPQDVWYDERQQLLKVELKGSDGSTIRYQLG